MCGVCKQQLKMGCDAALFPVGDLSCAYDMFLPGVVSGKKGQLGDHVCGNNEIGLIGASGYSLGEGLC